jgi:hypothetical protein
MSAVAAQLFFRTYRANPMYSSFAFAVRHSGLDPYRGSLSDVIATLRDDGAAPALEGSARDKPVALIGASTGIIGAVWAEGDLRVGSRDEAFPPLDLLTGADMGGTL